ncbi:MAG: SCP2 sterol-binding domain-containing protein [Lachnospiraceae bacterium]
MTYAEFFQEIKSRFAGTDVSSIHEHLAFQFNIEDQEAGGIFYVEVKDGQLHIEPYEYYDRHAIFIGSPQLFMKIAEGKEDPVEAFLTHKLKVEGDLDKALKLKEVIDRRKKERKKRK